MTESRIGRSLAIFRLALSFWKDSRRLERARRSVDSEDFKVREAEIYRQGGARFRDQALKMGGLIIKVGQFLSARTDILPLSFTRELTILQDQVPAAPWVRVKALMEDEWQKPLDTLFQSVDDQAVAAASLGQVHKGILMNGDVVAIKVQRPDIERLAQIDLSALAVVMQALERFTRAGRRINATRLFKEFSAMVDRELDYEQEVRHLQTFRKNFEDIGDVIVPDVRSEFTQRRVFVMDFVDGLKLTDPEILRAHDVSPVQIANIMIDAFLKQLIVDGFVQIDPHAGNFFARPDGKVVFLDFGMMGRIAKEDLHAIATLLQGVLTRDAAAVVEAIETLGFVREGASRPLLKKAVAFLLNQMAGTPLEPGQEMDQAVAEFQDFLYQEPLQFPAHYMFLGRAIGMLFGLVSGLNPEIEWMAVLKERALPLIARQQAVGAPKWLETLAGWGETWLGEERGAVARTVLLTGLKELQSWLVTPGQLKRILSQLDAGEIATKPDVTALLRRLDRAADLNEAQLSLLWAAGFGVAAVFLYKDFPRHAYVGSLVALLALIQAIRAMLFRKRARRRVSRGRMSNN